MQTQWEIYLLLYRRTGYFQSIFHDCCRNQWVKFSRVNGRKKPTCCCTSSCNPRVQVLMHLLLLSSLFFYEYAYWGQNFHLLYLADSITFVSCASLWSFRKRWSFALHMDIKERRSWWIANKYNLYGQSVPEVLFTPLYSANKMIPAHSLGLMPKNSDWEAVPLACTSGFTPSLWGNGALHSGHRGPQRSDETSESPNVTF